MYIGKQKGFTLVETLVAITVLLLVVIGPMTVAQKGIQSAYFATERATAVFLAQEAIEAVRELRDDAALDAFDEFVAGNTGNTSGWIPGGCASGCAYTGSGFVSCSSANGCQLTIDNDGQYGHGQGSDSGFWRRVFIADVGSQHADVKVVVSWNASIFGGGEHEITLQTWVYDQYERYEGN